MSNELKPCPFCGGDASIFAVNVNILEYKIACHNCFAEISRIGICPSVAKEKVINAWNRRASDE